MAKIEPELTRDQWVAMRELILCSKEERGWTAAQVAKASQLPEDYVAAVLLPSYGKVPKLPAVSRLLMGLRIAEEPLDLFVKPFDYQLVRRGELSSLRACAAKLAAADRRVADLQGALRELARLVVADRPETGAPCERGLCRLLRTLLEARGAGDGP
jgi:hypothetical protein